MPFNDTTNKNGVIQHIEDYVGFADGTITSDSTLFKKFTSFANETTLEVTTDLMLLQDGFDWDDPNRADYPIATTPLVENQRDYQFDAISFLKLKRVEITYDGTNYVRATAFDSSSIQEGLGNDSLADALFSKDAPKYDPKGFGFWLYPRASAEDVARVAKARIEYQRAHTMYTTTSTDQTPPIDRNFHYLIPLGTSVKWLSIKNPAKAEILEAKYLNGRAQMRQHYARRNEDAVLTLSGENLSNYK